MGRVRLIASAVLTVGGGALMVGALCALSPLAALVVIGALMAVVGLLMEV